MSVKITPIDNLEDIEIDLKDIPEVVLADKPIGHTEISIQKYAGTNACQWHYRDEYTGVYTSYGSVFMIEDVKS